MRLVAEGLSRSFGTRKIIGPLTFSLESGRVLGVAGENGSGKTTLLRVLAGLIRPSGGRGRLRGEAARASPPRDASHVLGWCAPDLALYGELTAEENLTFFAGVRGLAPRGRAPSAGSRGGRPRRLASPEVSLARSPRASASA